MPGPAMHHLIASRLKARIHRGTGLGEHLQPTDYQRLRDLLADPAHLPYLYLGCQGPDFLFFHAKDVNPAIGRVVQAAYDVYDFTESFRATLLAAVPQPVLDALEAIDEAADEVIEDSALLSELQQTFGDLNRLLTGFLAALLEKVKEFISEFNLFDLFGHPYRDGASEGEWWWFDALHYRKTGRLASALLEQTRDMTSPLHLYALGYLTHVAADTVGHPYVNINSGGPYRSHAQRHKTGENFQDVFNFLSVEGLDWNRSKLHALYNFNFGGSGAGDPDPDTRLPGDLAQLLADTLNQIYQEDADPGPDYARQITAEDLQDTYRTWYRWFKGATDTGTLPAPTGYSLSRELREVWDKTTENLGEVGDFLAAAGDAASELGILSIFLIFAAVVAAAVMAAAALADGIAGAIATLGAATIRAAACLIYEQLYNAFQSFRLGVALNGLAFPLKEHLGEPRFKQFIKPDNPDSSGVSALNLSRRLPLLRWRSDFLADPLGAIFSRERHLVYPLTAPEKPGVPAAPASYFSQLPTHYAFGDLALNGPLLGDLASLRDSPEAALLDLAAHTKWAFGNAADLSGALYSRWFQRLPLPDFNLDADRGYGYPCWTQQRPAQAPDPVNEPATLVTNQTSADPTTVGLTFIG